MYINVSDLSLAKRLKREPVPYAAAAGKAAVTAAGKSATSKLPSQGVPKKSAKLDKKTTKKSGEFLTVKKKKNQYLMTLIFFKLIR